MRPDEYARIYAAEETHWWYRSLHRLTLSLLDRHLGTRTDPPRLLDAGCGTGGMAAQLARRGAVTAMDYSPHALDFCRRRALPRLVRGSVNALPFGDACFDAVLSLDVLYHAAVLDDARAVRELARVLRPGGLLLLNLPAYDWLRGQHDIVIETQRRYTRRGVGQLLSAADLETVQLGYWNTLLFPAAAAVRLASRRRPAHGEADSDVGPVAPALNRALSGILALERRLMTVAPLPFGLSVIAVGRRPAIG